MYYGLHPYNKVRQRKESVKKLIRENTCTGFIHISRAMQFKSMLFKGKLYKHVCLSVYVCVHVCIALPFS